MSSSLENQSKSQKSLAEVVSTEKRLLPLMYSKGILHGDVLEVYHVVRTGFEEIILHSDQMAEIQEVEYLLWKLHYRHINEFRKRIRQQSFDRDNIKETRPQEVDSLGKIDLHLEGFKSLLSEAAKFYSDLILKLRRSCGLPEEGFLDDKKASSFSVEPTKLHKCQFTCHRLLICLGDLARYAETLRKPDARKWFVAANYYQKATKTWTESGNSHNQLALLATYVGDSFLALYHCLRSLEVKEPFPDAWRNLVLLFEENKSTQLPSSSSEISFDFYNFPGRNFSQNKSTAENGPPKGRKIAETTNASAEIFDLWPSVTRTISFFIIRSSLKEFPRTFAHTLSRLEAMLVVDDAELTATMESYEFVDSLRKGPYRAIQLVSAFIFVLHRLIENPKLKDTTEIDEKMSSECTPLALAAVLICMGRLIERCRKCNLVKCPLLPAVLVFVEWLVGALDEAETHVADERVVNAMSYFLGVLSNFVNRIDQNESGIAADNTALWEDHELRGFFPLAHVHEMLDFTTTHQEWSDDADRRRSQRILHAARRIMDRAKSSRDWISHDKEGINFYSFKREKRVGQAEEVAAASAGSSLEVMINAETFLTPKKTQSMTEKDEEVILFKPITRRNSAPIYTPQSMSHPVSPEATDTQRTFLDECLRRATTFSTSQQSEDGDSFSFCSTVSDLGQDRPFKDSTIHPAGPPSLSAWVLDRGQSKNETENGIEFNKPKKLILVKEVPSTSLSGLSISETKNFEVAYEPISTVARSSPPYVAPLPSAPFLPDHSMWLKMNPLISPEYQFEGDGILGAAPYKNGVPNRAPIGFTTPRVSGLVDGYPSVLGMSSSEWLYHYRNSQKGENTSDRISPLAYNAPPAFNNFQTNQVCRLDLCDQWGNNLVSNPMVSPQLYPNSSPVYGSVVEEQMRDKFFTGQRSAPYLCGVGMDIRQEQPPLLQYLKEREWLLQPELQLRGHTFIGN